ncbi:MAG: hypothetical protein LBP34_02115 [Flavobacteriaceae bacterium]|jgi:hypothetical protein|nr:hypothetical protein [Flavobacteriaceae bacterium]
MFQKKINLIGVLLFIALMIYSCIDDDICDKATTPRLTLVLDSLGSKYKKKQLYIDRKNTDGTVREEGIFSGKDSIQIPLNAMSKETVYYLYDSANTSESDKNIITIRYETEQRFVSKACGFKVIYNNITYEGTQLINIKSITPQTTSIHDESSTNLHIAYY